MVNNQINSAKVVQLLARPQFGRVYLTKALDTGSEQVFLEALHDIMDAIADELEMDLIEDCPLTLID